MKKYKYTYRVRYQIVDSDGYCLSYDEVTLKGDSVQEVKEFVQSREFLQSDEGNSTVVNEVIQL